MTNTFNKEKRMNETDFNQMQQKFLNGKITQQQWFDFCQNYLFTQVMTDPNIVQVFKRLKDR